MIVNAKIINRMRKTILLCLLFMMTIFGCKNRRFDNLPKSRLPSLYISISNEHLDSIIKNRKYKAPAHALLLSPEGDTILDDSLEHIKTRGNSTFKAEKKAYSIKFRKKRRFLGLDKGKRFALLANAFDESHIRNAVALDLASEIGVLAPRYSFLSLYINSDYKGLYQITNKVEDNPEFVNGSGFLIEKLGISQDTIVILPRYSTRHEKDSIMLLYDKVKYAIIDSTESLENLSKRIDVSSFVDIICFKRLLIIWMQELVVFTCTVQKILCSMLDLLGILICHCVRAGNRMNGPNMRLLLVQRLTLQGNYLLAFCCIICGTTRNI